jgi:leader peptidase (prepilin peptidase)/N-methyltransferase
MHDLVIYVAVFLFGAVVGSFLNVCIYRIPRGLSIIIPSSRCPSCNNPIQPWDNTPILSYILLKGRCRVCKAKIPVKYPLVESLNAVLYVIVFWKFGTDFSWFLLIYFIFLSLLIVITFIDIEYQIIPDGITLPGIVLALIFGSTVLPDPFSHSDLLGFKASISGILLGGGLFYAVGVLGTAVLKKDAMGGGDIKMMAMVGGVLGWKGVILTTFLGSLLGSIIGIFLIIIKGKERGSKIPFGPYLSLGATFSLLLGQEFLAWYLYAG